MDNTKSTMTTSGSQREFVLPSLASPWVYFVITFAWTWLFWGSGILFDVNFDITERANTISIALWFVASIAIVLLWGASTFTRTRQSQADAIQ